MNTTIRIPVYISIDSPELRTAVASLSRQYGDCFDVYVDCDDQDMAQAVVVEQVAHLETA